jgi:hypothetical protein
MRVGSADTKAAGGVAIRSSYVKATFLQSKRLPASNFEKRRHQSGACDGIAGVAGSTSTFLRAMC